MVVLAATSAGGEEPAQPAAPVVSIASMMAVSAFLTRPILSRVTVTLSRSIAPNPEIRMKAGARFDLTQTGLSYVDLDQPWA